MAELNVEIPGRATRTRVVIEPGLVDRFGGLVEAVVPARRILVVTDTTVGALWGERLTASLRGPSREVHLWALPPGERGKSLTGLGEILSRLAEIGLGRDDLILALGGGAVSDVTGLAAALWMRGVAFAICPTTLEADVDAALGGKTAINLRAAGNASRAGIAARSRNVGRAGNVEGNRDGHGDRDFVGDNNHGGAGNFISAKNLVGAFHQPRLVGIDPECLKTLPARDVRAGLAESVKHGFVFDESLVSFHEQRADDILRLDPETLAELIHWNVRIKMDVVRADATERSGRRLLLNFGHTVGHAIEATTGYALRHGECVALGMMAACFLSERLCGLASETVERMERLLRRLGLPTTWSDVATLADDSARADDSVPAGDSTATGDPALVDDSAVAGNSVSVVDTAVAGNTAVPNVSALADGSENAGVIPPADDSAVPDHADSVGVSDVTAPARPAAAPDPTVRPAAPDPVVRAAAPDWFDLNRAMSLDKKRVAGTDRFVLLEALAQPAIHTNIPPTAVHKACRRLGLCEERE